MRLELRGSYKKSEDQWGPTYNLKAEQSEFTDGVDVWGLGHEGQA